jgi:uncharacterized protein (DUF433 family)
MDSERGDIMAVILNLDPSAVPLTRLDNGVYRVTGTRIPLERIVEHHRAGETPEQIVDAYDTLRLADVYTIIGYYLDHKEAVEEYVREQDEEGEAMRRMIEAAQPPRPGFKEELLRRWAALVDRQKQEKAIHMNDDTVDLDAFRRGESQAREDIAVGRLCYRRNGHPGPWRHEFAMLMRARFRVQVIDSGSCLVNPEITSFDDGYNGVVIRQIASIHGLDAFFAVVEEAKRLAALRHREWRDTKDGPAS